MTITESGWKKYIERLRKINDKAAADMAKQLSYVDILNIPERDYEEIIQYAYRLTQKYGEASAAVSCEMYDALAQLAGRVFEPAVPAETATYHEVAKVVTGTLKSGNVNVISSAVGRLVKMTGEDTMLKNAIRDGAECAWIPVGMTCAFCVTLGSRGWEPASKSDLKDGHAKHIHANCDCAYAVRFDRNTTVAGYDPDKLYRQYRSADGRDAKDKINSMRRKYYAENREKILEQKRTAYERSKALESSTAEETKV